MGNICSIFHKQFNKLVKITTSYNKAIFLEKCLYWWQLSKYSLNDNQIWFTRPYEAISDELNISLSSVNRWLKEFEDAGLIERKTKLSGSSKNGYKVTKRTYIRITDKLISLLQEPASITNDKPICTDNKQKDIIENVTETFSLYKEFNSKPLVNNTVSQSYSVNNSKYPTYDVEQQIGERLSTREKNYIKSMMNNLQKNHGVVISAPEELFAEIVFSVLNEHQLSGIGGLNHKIQIIAKLLRENRWSTPKGFYNHCDFGAQFRKTVSKSDVPFVKTKNDTTITTNKYVLEKQIKALNDRLNVISQEIRSEIRQLSFFKHSETEALTRSITKKIEQLKHEENTIKTEQDLLKSALEKEIKPKFGSSVSGKFEQYNDLCNQQQTLKINVEAAKKDYDYALTEMPDDSLYEVVSERYRNQVKKLQLLEEEIYLLGEELYSNKVA